MTTRHDERGAIAAYALAVLAVMSIVTGSWLRVVAAKVESASLDGREVRARLLAHAGIERVLAWFADPSAVDGTIDADQVGECGAPSDLAAVFRKRCLAAQGLPSFVGSDGSRQFVGTIENPGVRVLWSGAETALDPPPDLVGEPRGAPRAARVELRIFAPQSPEAVATVVSRATVEGASTAVRAELVEGPWRGFPRAVTIRDLGATTIPVRVHWSDVAVDGSADLTAILDRLPLRDPLAPITGSAYPSEPGSDRWAGVIASGGIVGIPRDGIGFARPFEHVRDGVYIGPLGIWPHNALRAFAREHGVYFATRGTGLLYPGDGGPGLSPSAALAASSGSGRLVFIDTLDGAPPREDNLDTLDLTVDHFDAVAYIGAHLRLGPGTGRSVTLDTPPALDSADGRPSASGITVGAVHYRGVLVVVGDLSASGRVNLVGALAALRGVRDASAIEVWYDAALRQGYRSGFPPVVVKPGSRRVIIFDGP
ncbi:MAG: hypothetical protein ACOYXU_10885 [Nitrospirota bacterium]